MNTERGLSDAGFSFCPRQGSPDWYTKDWYTKDWDTKDGGPNE
ncbi:MAG: hypothetical protein ACKO3W_00090 [bacterium]